MTGVSTVFAKPRRLTAPLVALAACMWVSAGTASAQVADNSPAPAVFSVQGFQPPSDVAASTDFSPSIRRSIVEHSERADQYLQREAPGLQPSQPKRERSGWRRFAGGAVGAAGGFFAGGYIGAAIDGDCGGCDDPGLKGALIGAPIGALLGGIAGALWLF